MARKPVSQMTAEELEKFRKYKRKKYEEYRARNLERERERQRSASRDYRSDNVQSIREADRIRKRIKRESDSESINQYQRQLYANDVSAATKQRDRRYKREPNRLIRSSTNLFGKGIIGSDEYIERVNRAVTYSNQIHLGERKPGRKKAD